MSSVMEAVWHTYLARAFVEAGVEVGVWVPDKRLSPIAAELTVGGLPMRTLGREEDCVGYAAGFRAAGGMPLALFQCSGLGNAQNALASLAIPYGLGFPIVMSMRGTLGERNPSQVPFGRAAAGILALIGAQAFSLRNCDQVSPVVAGALALAREARQVPVILLEPELDLP